MANSSGCLTFHQALKVYLPFLWIIFLCVGPVASLLFLLSVDLLALHYADFIAVRPAFAEKLE